MNLTLIRLIRVAITSMLMNESSRAQPVLL